MKIKIQNILFLFGIYAISTPLHLLVMIAITLISYLISNDNINNGATWFDYSHIYLYYTYLPLTIILSTINIFNNKVASFIHDKTVAHIPTLRWYTMFWGPIGIITAILPETWPPIIVLSSLTCVAAALFNKRNGWTRRIIVAFLFLGMSWLSVLGMAGMYMSIEEAKIREQCINEGKIWDDDYDICRDDCLTWDDEKVCITE